MNCYMPIRPNPLGLDPVTVREIEGTRVKGGWIDSERLAARTKAQTEISPRPGKGRVSIWLYDALDFSTYCYGRRGQTCESVSRSASSTTAVAGLVPRKMLKL
jgi:hypothetical protein